MAVVPSGAIPHVGQVTEGSPFPHSRTSGVARSAGAGYVGRMAVHVDYRRFLSEWRTSDSANVDLDVTDPPRSVWLREIAEPWWAAIGELARADGFVVDTFEGHPPDEALHRVHTPCAHLVMPDGTPYHRALHSTQIQEAAYRDYGIDVICAARERHRLRLAVPDDGAAREPYASPLFTYPEPTRPAGRLRWRRSRV
jgi:hypothetical protein